MLPEAAHTDGNDRYFGADTSLASPLSAMPALDFGLSDIRTLIDLADQSDQDCAAVDRITHGHLRIVEATITQLAVLRSELMRMLDQCRGGQVADCRIIESLSDHASCRSAHASSIGSFGAQSVYSV